MTIIIVGGGTSGLTAALTLLFHGVMDFIILESTDMVGGRMNDDILDLGLYDGKTDNELVNVLKEKNLIIKKSNSFWKSSMTLSNGDKIPEKTVNKMKKIIDSVFTGDYNNLDDSFGDQLRKKFTDSVQNKEIDARLADQFLQLFEKYYCSFNGYETASDISSKNYKTSESLYELKNVGIETILAAFEAHFNVTGVRERIQYKKKVTKIMYEKDEVEVLCEDGTTFTGTHVIVTLPLGVLKEVHSKTFIPPLPDCKVNAIQSFGVGTTNKVLIEFEKPWWDSDWSGSTFIWNESDLSRLKNTNYFWIQGVVGIYPVERQSNVLLAIIHGKSSVLMEIAKESDVQKGFKYLLKHFLKTDQKPRNIKITKYATDTNTRGSHTYNTISAEMFGVSRNDLASPVYNSKGSPVLFFSGEATSQENYGTLIGALESGKQAASHVFDVLSGKIPLKREKRETTTKLETSVDVLILGAGAAGIGAANKLENTDLSYLIIEGSDGVGGRIRNKYMTNTNPNLKEKVLVAAGAQWLHGRRNPLYTYAKNMDLVVFDKSQTEDGKFIRDDGVEIGNSFADQVEEIVEDILEEADEFYWDEKISKYPESLDKFLTKRFEQKIQSFTTERKIKARQLLDWHKRSIAVDNGAEDFKKISAKHWGRFEYIGGKWEYISLKNGLAQVLELMAKDVGADKFVFNKVVEKVHWASEMTFNGSDNVEKKNILVQCTDGSLYTANHVIVTFSLGVLKHDADKMFVPSLPQKHKDAINCLGFGPVTKIFLQFESNWWGDAEGLQFIHRETELDDEEETNFIRYMTGFDLIYTGPSNTMIGWVGQKGVELMEKLSDKEIVDAIMAHVENFLGYTVSYPKRYFISRWLNNPLTRGAYSYASVDCDKDDITPKDLATKITFFNQYTNAATTATKKDGLPLLQFAGEGSSQIYHSTAHGAYITGENAAKEINKYYSRSKRYARQVIDHVKYKDLTATLGYLPSTFVEDIVEKF